MKKNLLALAITWAFAAAAQAECYSEGVRVGVVQKFSQKGFAVKSWEGEMVQDGVRVKARGQGAAATNIWKFSVTDPEVAKQIDAAVFDGGEVAVKYCEAFPLTNFGKTDTPYVVVAAKVRK